MQTYTVVGLIAAVFTSISLFPQLIKVLKTKHTKDLSLSMYLIFTTGILLWFIYGIMINDLPIIIANSITLIFSIFILVMKFIYK